MAVMDNLTMNLNYHTYMREGEGGERKDMTNWFTSAVPRFIAPPTFNADLLWSNPFRMDLSLGRFSRSFFLTCPDLAAHRSNRWTK